MALNKNSKIIIAVAAILVVAGAGLGAYFIWFQYPDYNLAVTNDVEEDVTMSYGDLMKGAGKKYSVAEVTMNFTTRVESSLVTVKGFPFQTLLDELEIDTSEQAAFEFCASDGWSRIIPKATILEVPTNAIIVAYEIDGERLDDEDGYFRLMVNKSVVGSSPNSGYCISNLIEIKMIPDWEIEFTAHGNSGTIHYYELLLEEWEDEIAEDVYIYADKNGGYFEEFTATGIPLLNITDNILDWDVSNYNKVNFTASDGYEKEVLLSAITGAELEEVLLGYLVEGERLDRLDDEGDLYGPVRMFLNGTVVAPSYGYCLKAVQSIEFWDPLD